MLLWLKDNFERDQYWPPVDPEALMRRKEMSLYDTDKEVKKLIKQLGYKGCKNCRHQIEPLRMCEWAEQGGDGRLHFICPMWDKAEREENR